MIRDISASGVAADIGKNSLLIGIHRAGGRPAGASSQNKTEEMCLAAACSSFGLAYEAGHGVPQDYVQAYKWFNLSASQGCSNAQNSRDRVAQIMTSEQIAEAQRLSSKFVPRNESGGSTSNNSTSPENPTASGTGFFITDDGCLISNYHVVKGAVKVRLLRVRACLALRW